MERLVKGRGRERKEEWARQWEAGTMPSPLMCVSGDRVFVSLSTQLLHGRFCGGHWPPLGITAHTVRLHHTQACDPQSLPFPVLYLSRAQEQRAGHFALQTPVLEPTHRLFELGTGERKARRHQITERTQGGT